MTCPKCNRTTLVLTKILFNLKKRERVNTHECGNCDYGMDTIYEISGKDIVQIYETVDSL